MSNLVNTNRPLQIQYRKKSWRSDESAFFWGNPKGANDNNKYYAEAKKQVNFLDGINHNPNKSNQLNSYLDAVSNKLKDLYQMSLKREEFFIQQLEKQAGEKGKLSSPIIYPNSVSDQTNEVYARNFNKIVKNFFNADQNLLRTLFLDLDYASFLASPKNYDTFSLTQAAEIASGEKKVSVNEATRALLNLFLTDSNEKAIRTGGNTPELKKLLKRKIDDKWITLFIKYLSKYIYGADNPAFQAIESQILGAQRQAIINSVRGILDEAFSDKGTWRKVYFSGKNRDEKGISTDFETTMKGIFKQVMKSMQSKGVDLNLDGTPISIQRNISGSSNFYKDTVSITVYELKNDNSKKEEMINILLRALEQSINLYLSSSNKYNSKQKLQIKYQYFPNNRQLIRDVIMRDLNRNRQNQIKDSSDIAKILVRWGRSQIRGFLGEVAAALTVLDGGNNTNEAMITGSSMSESGQISMDVQVKILGENFGIQVKNLRSLKQSNFYKTDFNITEDNIMKKYFGDDAKNYYWLFANQKMLDETGLLKTANFNRWIRNSFYKYTDNFLRVSSGDIEGVFNRSDLYFIGDKIIPSSYLYYKIITTVKNSKNKERFELNQVMIPEYKSLEKGKKVPEVQEIKSLIKTFNAKIIFKGISFDLSNFV